VEAVRSRATDEDPEDLEDAIVGVAGSSEEARRAAAEIEKRRAPVDCLIVGYTLNQEKDDVEELILAREFAGKLIIVGRVPADADETIRRTYLAEFRKVARRTPFVNSGMTANWIEPVFTCRVTCRTEESNGRLHDMRYEKMLMSIDDL
jgi:hypothetical protein